MMPASPSALPRLRLLASFTSATLSCMARELHSPLHRLLQAQSGRIRLALSQLACTHCEAVAIPPPHSRPCGFCSLHNRAHHQERVPSLALNERTVGNVSQRLSDTCHSVWGRVVRDLPDFCRELM